MVRPGWTEVLKSERLAGQQVMFGFIHLIAIPRTGADSRADTAINIFPINGASDETFCSRTARGFGETSTSTG